MEEAGGSDVPLGSVNIAPTLEIRVTQMRKIGGTQTRDSEEELTDAECNQLLALSVLPLLLTSAHAQATHWCILPPPFVINFI